MEKLNYSIKEEYSHELNEIGNKLKQLKDGRVYELSNAKMDGFLSTNVQKLESEICELLSKIQNGNEGTTSEMAKWFMFS